MQLSLPTDLPAIHPRIGYTDGMLLMGSCFTEHIAGRLAQHQFRTLQNPHGILFNPLSMAHSLDRYLEDRPYGMEDLFYLHETWHSWDHHTRFSGMDPQQVLEGINASVREAARFIRQADWLILTPGSAYQYYLKDSGRPVANNHRAPAQWFEKQLLDTQLIQSALSQSISQLQRLNPKVQILFTISPVRHIREGVVNNNRSKARLIEAVHSLCDLFPACHYFPAYELVIDILRDYRFYDLDFVHPNYLATETVWETFVQTCVDPTAIPLMEQVKDIMTARAHKPRFPLTNAHRKFMQSYAAKVSALMRQFPLLHLEEELRYFESGS